MDPQAHKLTSLPEAKASSRSVAVLCGGRSTRLGSDKGLYKALGDEPLFARLLRQIEGLFDELLIVVRDTAQAAAYQNVLADHLRPTELNRVRLVTDESYGEHTSCALTGITTALAASRHDTVLVCPVDQVGVRSMHIRKLLQAREGTPLPPTAFEISGDVLPFPSLWSKTDAAPLTALLNKGERSVRHALHRLNVQCVDGLPFEEELSLNGNTQKALTDYFGEPLFDPFGRRLHYLRFSLTEACNLACTYCLPDGYPEWFRAKARLSQNDIATLLRGFRKLGFRKVRFTGGEPTVHPSCLAAIRQARLMGYEKIAMTTNGLLLKDLGEWVDAGLSELNVSLDSLNEDMFYAVTRSRGVRHVRELIEAAAAQGLTVKVNTVLMRTKNGDLANIAELLDWALGLPITLRFIELMETKLNGDFSGHERILGREIEPLLMARGLSQESWHQGAPDLRGPSTDYASPAHLGKIGLINPMSCNFCSKCNRLRITARGRLKLCLFGDADLPLDLSSATAVALNVRRLIDRKPERHYLEDGNVGNVATFRTIGG